MVLGAHLPHSPCIKIKDYIITSLFFYLQLVSPPIKYFKLEEVNDAFKLMDQGKMNGRGVFKFD